MREPEAPRSGQQAELPASLAQGHGGRLGPLAAGEARVSRREGGEAFVLEVGALGNPRNQSHRTVGIPTLQNGKNFLLFIKN